MIAMPLCQAQGHCHMEDSMEREILWNGVSLHNPQDQFRLGTDSMVLADFVHPKKSARVCDLGCGVGAISMMLLATDPTLQVTGVEIQEESARLAEENAKFNSLPFTAICGDLRNIRNLLPHGGFDVVVSNPPYFSPQNPATDAPSLRTARTEETCTSEDVCKAGAWLLQTGGKMCLVHRPERLADVLCALRENRLEPKRIQFFRHSETSKRSLFLVEAVRDAKAGLTLLEDLILYDALGNPTEDFCRIYHK